MPLTDAARKALYQARVEQSRYDEAVDEVVRELENHVRYCKYMPLGEIERRISSRVKEFDRIEEKVDIPRKRSVGSLADLEARVTDIAGVRVVLDRLDQVKETGTFIQDNGRWRILRVEKCRRGYTGYRSLHVDVELDTTHHKSVRCEIQCRTLLEHAFALWTTPLYQYYRTDPKSVPPVLFGRMREISDALHHVDKQVNGLAKEFRRLAT